MADGKKPQTEETEVDAREYFSILWKGKWIIIIRAASLAQLKNSMMIL